MSVTGVLLADRYTSIHLQPRLGRLAAQLHHRPVSSIREVIYTSSRVTQKLEFHGVLSIVPRSLPRHCSSPPRSRLYAVMLPDSRYLSGIVFDDSTRRVKVSSMIKIVGQWSISMNACDVAAIGHCSTEVPNMDHCFRSDSDVLSLQQSSLLSNQLPLYFPEFIFIVF